jgi:transposase
MNPRQQRGLTIAALCRLTRQDDGTWVVPSQTVEGRKYQVNFGQQKCTCLDCVEGGFRCKHQFAVEFVLKRELGADGTVTEMKSVTFTETKLYKQDWPSYNLAQTTEKHRFQALLSDLCQGVPQPPRPQGKRGRLPVLLSDAVFASTFKVYSTVSTRRFACDLKDAHERGYVSKPIHYNSICNYLENPELTPILNGLIAQSALPLKAVERDFAIDSSGFSSSKFVRWFDHKYGRERRGHTWVKVHLACGVKTNIVTAVRILDKDAGDAPQFAPLLKTTAENFRISEVSADSAYSSRKNIETVAGFGGTAFIAFKVNATGGVGGLFEKMLHYYQFRQEEFLGHYHKRSNVESTFSMVKRKFGDHIRSRTDTAMVNEVLEKVLCHNLCVVIQSQCELGIEPVFWGQRLEKRGEATDVFPCNRITDKIKE